MRIQFNVYKLDIKPSFGDEVEGGVAIEMWEFGTHHRFVAHFREPRSIVFLQKRLWKLIKDKGWDTLGATQTATDPLPPKSDDEQTG